LKEGLELFFVRMEGNNAPFNALENVPCDAMYKNLQIYLHY